MEDCLGAPCESSIDGIINEEHKLGLRLTRNRLDSKPDELDLNYRFRLKNNVMPSQTNKTLDSLKLT